MYKLRYVNRDNQESQQLSKGSLKQTAQASQQNMTLWDGVLVWRNRPFAAKGNGLDSLASTTCHSGMRLLFQVA